MMLTASENDKLHEAHEDFMRANGHDEWLARTLGDFDAMCKAGTTTWPEGHVSTVPQPQQRDG